MATFGWVLLAVAILIFIMVANNSWSFVWTKILAGMGGPTPAPPISQQSRTGGQDRNSGNIQTPPTQLVTTVNGVVQSQTGNQATA